MYIIDFKFNEILRYFQFFSKAESFDSLLKRLDSYNPTISEVETKYKHFEIYIYKPIEL